MPSSTPADKEKIKEIYGKLQAVSCSGSLKKPSFNSVVRDIEVFDNGKYVVWTKKGKWCELERK